jgi:uncharacterized protein (TIGR02266 family)
MRDVQGAEMLAEEREEGGPRPEERRAHPRADVAVEVQYQTPQAFVAAYTRNISGGGIFVETDHPRPLNDQLTVGFRLPGVDHAFLVRCTVAWCQLRSTHAFPAGMGLRFLNLTKAEVQMVSEFVRHHLAGTDR